MEGKLMKEMSVGDAVFELVAHLDEYANNMYLFEALRVVIDEFDIDPHEMGAKLYDRWMEWQLANDYIGPDPREED